MQRRARRPKLAGMTLIQSTPSRRSVSSWDGRQLGWLYCASAGGVRTSQEARGCSHRLQEGLSPSLSSMSQGKASMAKIEPKRDKGRATPSRKSGGSSSLRGYARICSKEACLEEIRSYFKRGQLHLTSGHLSMPGCTEAWPSSMEMTAHPCCQSFKGMYSGWCSHRHPVP